MTTSADLTGFYNPKRFSLDVTQRNGQWVAYVHRNGLAFEVFNGSLDACREYARCCGFPGVVIGSPSVPWGN